MQFAQKKKKQKENTAQGCRVAVRCALPNRGGWAGLQLARRPCVALASAYIIIYLNKKNIKGMIPGEAIAYEYFFFAANDFNRPNAINVI